MRGPAHRTLPGCKPRVVGGALSSALSRASTACCPVTPKVGELERGADPRQARTYLVQLEDVGVSSCVSRRGHARPVVCLRVGVPGDLVSDQGGPTVGERRGTDPVKHCLPSRKDGAGHELVKSHVREEEMGQKDELVERRSWWVSDGTLQEEVSSARRPACSILV